MGRVLNIYPGEDGVVRVAEVKTGNGLYTRPVTKLCLPLYTIVIYLMLMFCYVVYIPTSY